MTLTGRTALVTGAGSGIGRAAAIALARAGAEVVLVGRDAARLEEVRAAIGAAARCRPLDLAAPGAVDSLDEPVDVLVHAAAAYAPYGRLETQDEADVRRVIDTGLVAAAALCARLVPGMRERGFGRLVLIGSAAASHGAPGQAAYAAAKAGLVGLARSLAAEAGRAGVTANVVELGFVDTERTAAQLTDEVRARLVANTAVGRPGTPEEVADVLAFLASPASAFINGATLAVDGGLGLGVVPPREGEPC